MGLKKALNRIHQCEPVVKIGTFDWYVLEEDLTNNTATLISERVVAILPFSYHDESYENSYISKYFIPDFVENNLPKRIKSILLSGPDIPTMDDIRYYCINEECIARHNLADEPVSWWVRNASSVNNYQSVFNAEGHTELRLSSSEDVGIRLIMTISLDLPKKEKKKKR